VKKVAELPPGALDVAIEVGRIASAPGSGYERATALVDPLRRVLPFEAIWVALMDTEQRKFVPLVNEGYSERAQRYFESSEGFDEAELLGIGRPLGPMRLRDLPFPADDIHGWVEYVRPSGFREGLGMALYAPPDGRLVGLLATHYEAKTQPTDAARNLIGMLGPTIAAAVDPMRSIRDAARVVDDAVAGVVLTNGGRPIALPGLGTHPLLADGSDVLAASIERRLDGRVYSSFLCPYQSDDGPDGHIRVTMLACPPEPPHQVMAIVLLSPPGDVRGLTRRELEILGLLVDGWSNGQVAAALVIAERTVATHVEHILAKLTASSRALAAVRALRYGLYVPRPLNGVRC
jgi:DNA-binding CsgD family transcriptional regulator